MNQTETVLLCRYAKAMCPAQAIDEYTPDAWAEVLYDVSLDDAKAAVVEGVRERGWRFIDAAEIVKAVRATRAKRLETFRHTFGPLMPLSSLDGQPGAEAAWMRETYDRIRAGEVTHPDQLGENTTVAPLPRHDVRQLGLVGREVPGA